MNMQAHFDGLLNLDRAELNEFVRHCLEGLACEQVTDYPARFRMMANFWFHVERLRLLLLFKKRIAFHAAVNLDPHMVRLSRPKCA